jgi:uncharacterized damage-inducible protein DinB
MREMLIDTIAYIPPARALEGLTPEDADRRLPGANHTIAEIVAHMDFWLNWFCTRCEGSGLPMVTSAADGWPAVAPGTWPALRDSFLRSLERAAALDKPDRIDARVTPPIEFPPIAEYTVRDALVHAATHNAHHLGQVVLLRQLMGLWPPASGSWTW